MVESNGIMDIKDFKGILAKNIFCATTSDELSAERTFEIADDIADKVIEAAKEYINNKK